MLREINILVILICLINNSSSKRFIRDTENDEYVVKCGRKLDNISQPFIVNGQNAKYGQFPWHVAIYSKNKNDVNSTFEYICGGTIISETSVLSVAHCFTTYDGKKIYSNLYAIGAGKYYNNYNSPLDLLVQKRQVVDVEIHPQYKGINSNYAWDIAVVLIDKPFVISDVVQPVCIDIESQLENIQLRSNNYGYVPGWGFTEKNLQTPNLFKPSEELKVLRVPFIDRQKCLEVLPADFLVNLTPDKFCAGHLNGSSVCNGDSGSGLVFPQQYQKQTLYFLRGIVSVGLQNEGICDNLKYSTYTKISHHVSFFQDYVQNSCYTPNQELARCIPIHKCKTFTKVIANETITPEIYQFITDSVCGSNNDKPLVCCGKTTKYTNTTFRSRVVRKRRTIFRHKNLKLLPRKCGVQNFQYNSLGEYITGLDEFPWILKKIYNSDTSIEQECPGVLISDRYVLTTARCIAMFDDGNNGTFKFTLRFGEYDLSTELDCVNTTDINGKKYEQCADPYVDAALEKFIPHPEYQKPYADIYQNDIGLIRLANKINFTRYIQPICLPLYEETTKTGDNLILADWPYFFHSNAPTNYTMLLTRVKQKINIPVVNFQKCYRFYPYSKRAKLEVTPSQICGGGVEGVDVCGSTGGPLINILPNTTQFYIEGLVSYGPYCAAPDVPSVYTKVSYFLKWILDNMEP